MIVVFAVVMILIWRFLGSYMAAVYQGRVRYLAFIEGPIYRLVGVDPEVEQSWQRYAGSLIAYSAVAILVVYGMIRLQGSLPLNPQHLGAVSPALSFNTAVSFVTNTNWQNYGGRVDDDVPVADGRPRRPELRLRLGRDRRRDRYSGIRPPRVGDDRQLLGRPLRGMLYILLPIALRRRHHLHRPGRHPDLRRPGDRPRRPERRHPDDPPRPVRLPGGDQGARARTAAGRTTPTAPTPSRTRPG